MPVLKIGSKVISKIKVLKKQVRLKVLGHIVKMLFSTERSRQKKHSYKISKQARFKFSKKKGQKPRSMSQGQKERSCQKEHSCKISKLEHSLFSKVKV